jgi:(2R)-ethylmalonyl-CoA mutase
VTEVLERMRAAGIDDVPLIVGGIIPDADAAQLLRQGVARVYTPKDFDLNRIMRDIVRLADPANREAA